MSDMNNNTTSKLVPAMFIGIGTFSQRILKGVSKLYLRSNPERADVTRFLCLGQNESQKSKFDLFEISKSTDQIMEISFPQDGNVSQRQLFIEDLVRSSTKIRASMAEYLHEIQTHVSNMEVNLDYKPAKPLYLFIIADMVDPMASTALIPLALLLQDISQSASNPSGSVFLNVAIFPDKNDQDDHDEARLYYSLDQLDQVFIDTKQDWIQQIFKAMDIRSTTPLQFPAYLFDYRKPLSNNVKDSGELEKIMINTLVGFLLGNISAELEKKIDESYKQKNRAFYNGAGTACLLYDPHSLIDACAFIYSRTVLDEGFLNNDPGKDVQIDLNNRMLSTITSASDWYIKLLAGTSLTVELDDKMPGIIDQLVGLTLDPVNYESIHTTSWVQQINEYIKKFDLTLFPEIKTIVSSQRQNLQDDLIASLSKLVNEKVEDPDLYPDGLNVILTSLNELLKELENRRSVFEKKKSDLKKHLKDINISENLKRIQDVLDEALILPRWWHYLPKKISKWASLIINHRWIRRNIFMLDDLKKHTLEEIKNNHASNEEIYLLGELIHMIDALNSELEIVKQSLEKFLSVIRKVRNKFPITEWSEIKFPLGSDDIDWDENFLVPVVSKEVALWAYEQLKQPIKTKVSQLLKEDHIFGDWQYLTEDILYEVIFDSCKIPFANLSQKTINSLLEKRQELYELTQTSTANPPDPISPLVRASLPLIRSNFDAIGGKVYSDASKYLLAADKNSDVIGSIFKSNRDLTWINTGDDYSIMASTIEYMLPLKAFKELNENLKIAYQRLSAQAKKRLNNVFVPIPKLEGEDYCEKVFSWEHKESNEKLEIVLPISNDRYRIAKQENRLPSKEWSKYVKKESPELNYLAACFLNIFLQHPNWTSFDQTSVILSFVQHCIEYQFDKDSTPLSEWPRYPIETLYEGIGDCEDVSILTAAIMNRLGFKVALLHLPGHCALGIAGVPNLPGTYVEDTKSGTRYYYAESTATGWQIGKIPEEYKETNIEIDPIDRLIETA